MVRRRKLKKGLIELKEEMGIEENVPKKRKSKRELFFVFLIGAFMLLSGFAYSLFYSNTFNQKEKNRELHKRTPQPRPTIAIPDVYSMVEGVSQKTQGTPEPASAQNVRLQIKAVLPALMVFATRNENTTYTNREVLNRILEMKGDVTNASIMDTGNENITQISVYLNITKYLLNTSAVKHVADKIEALMLSGGFVDINVYQAGIASPLEEEINMTVGGERRVIKFSRDMKINTFVYPPAETGKNITAFIRGEVVGNKPFYITKDAPVMTAFEERLVWRILPS